MWWGGGGRLVGPFDLFSKFVRGRVCRGSQFENSCKAGYYVFPREWRYAYTYTCVLYVRKYLRKYIFISLFMYACTAVNLHCYAPTKAHRSIK